MTEADPWFGCWVTMAVDPGFCTMQELKRWPLLTLPKLLPITPSLLSSTDISKYTGLGEFNAQQKVVPGTICRIQHETRLS
jgi:hypothetical protein